MINAWLAIQDAWNVHHFLPGVSRSANQSSQISTVPQDMAMLKIVNQGDRISFLDIQDAEPLLALGGMARRIFVNARTLCQH